MLSKLFGRKKKLVTMNEYLGFVAATGLMYGEIGRDMVDAQRRVDALEKSVFVPKDTNCCATTEVIPPKKPYTYTVTRVVCGEVVATVITAYGHNTPNGNLNLFDADDNNVATFAAGWWVDVTREPQATTIRPVDKLRTVLEKFQEEADMLRSMVSGPAKENHPLTAKAETYESARSCLIQVFSEELS